MLEGRYGACARNCDGFGQTPLSRGSPRPRRLVLASHPGSLSTRGITVFAPPPAIHRHRADNYGQVEGRRAPIRLPALPLTDTSGQPWTRPLSADQTMDELDPATVASRHDLVACLKHIHLLADKPTYRVLEKQTIHANGVLPGTQMTRVRLTRATLSDVLRGRKFPSKAFLLTFVEACGIDLAKDRRWEQAWGPARRPGATSCHAARGGRKNPPGERGTPSASRCVEARSRDHGANGQFPAVGRRTHCNCGELPGMGAEIYFR